MSLEDPFFVVKGEVEKAVSTSESLYQRWCELLHDTDSVPKDKLEWTTNELKNSLKSIEWDVEDLEETIGIVEANPRKFKIMQEELESRRRFVSNTKSRLEQMKAHMNSPTSRSKQESATRKGLFTNGPKKTKGKYTRLENEMESENQRFIEDQSQQQQLIMEAQDDQMDRVADSVSVLKHMGQTIGNEFDEQAVMLDGFSTELENTETKLDSVMKKMAKVTKMSNDKRQWTAIIFLVVILFIVLLLLIVL